MRCTKEAGGRTTTGAMTVMALGVLSAMTPPTNAQDPARDLSGYSDPVTVFTVQITVDSPPGTSAVAVAMWIPRGWTVVTMSDGGQWDEIHRKVKWGPTFGDLAQSMTLRVRWHPGDAVPVSRRSARGGLAGGRDGVVSFDGVNQPISMR